MSLDPTNRPAMFDGMELLMRLNTATLVVRDTSRIKKGGATCQLEAMADLQIAADLPQMLKMVRHKPSSLRHDSHVSKPPYE